MVVFGELESLEHAGSGVGAGQEQLIGRRRTRARGIEQGRWQAHAYDARVVYGRA